MLTVKDLRQDVEKVPRPVERAGAIVASGAGLPAFPKVYHSQSDSRVFILSEHWASQADLDRHREATAYMTIYKPQVIPLVDRVPHPSELVVSG